MIELLPLGEQGLLIKWVLDRCPSTMQLTHRLLVARLPKN